MTTLRDYQVRAVADLRARIAAGKGRLLLVSPTGSGKTTVAAEMIRGAVAREGAVLFLAHRRELIDQCSARLDGIGVDHGIVMAGHPRAAPLFPVQVASVPTLARRLDRLPRATLIIVDEAHHARADSYANILDAYAGVPVVGLTATPWRLDNRGLGDLFEDIVVATTPRELIAQGHLVPYTGYVYDSPDLARVRKSGGDFEQRGLELVMRRAKLAGNVVEQWLQHCRGKRTVVFAVSVAHSQQLVERFQAAGVPAEHLDGTTPIGQRAEILRRLGTGDTQIVCNVNVLTEGWDLPALEVVVLARPTLSVGLYMQMVGRGMRPADGKDAMRIHDHAGLILRHGLPDAHREYTLATSKPKGEALPVLHTCPECFATFEGRTCPACGAELGGTDDGDAPPMALEGEGTPVPLEELQQLASDRAAFLERALAEAESRGRKPGWAAYRYKERFGEWPPASFWWRHRRVSPERIAKLNQLIAGGGQ